jgi:hypothetical protein
MTEHDGKQKYLVVDDYGTGGIWFMLYAESEDKIKARLRDVKVYAPGTKPDWMSHASLNEIAERRTFDIDKLPTSAWMDRLRIDRK